jgi:MFS family permease
MFSELPIGVLSDRKGPRILLIIGRVMAIIGAFLCYVATEVWQVVLARALWGVGDAAFFCIGMVYVANLFPAEKRGRALGTFQAVEMIGLFLGQSIAGFISSGFGIRSNFLVCAALGMVALLIVTRIRGESSKDYDIETSKNNSRRSISTVLSRIVVSASLINFFMMVLNGGISETILPIYVTEDLNIPLTQYGFLLSVSTVGSVLGNFVGGILSDKVGRKKVLVLGFIIGSLSVFFLSLSNTFQIFVPVMLMLGFFGGSIYGITPALIADSVPESARGMSIGVFRTFFDLGGLTGPIIMASIVDYVGRPQGYITSFYVGSGLALLGLLIVWQIKEKSKR